MRRHVKKQFFNACRQHTQTEKKCRRLVRPVTNRDPFALTLKISTHTSLLRPDKTAFFSFSLQTWTSRKEQDRGAAWRVEPGNGQNLVSCITEFFFREWISPKQRTRLTWMVELSWALPNLTKYCGYLFAEWWPAWNTLVLFRNYLRPNFWF